jgi:hypothetical protein
MRTLEFKLTKENPTANFELTESEKSFIIECTLDDFAIITKYTKNDKHKSKYDKICLTKIDSFDMIEITVTTLS